MALPAHSYSVVITFFNKLQQQYHTNSTPFLHQQHRKMATKEHAEQDFHGRCWLTSP